MSQLTLFIITLTVISITSTGILAYNLYKRIYSPKIDILQTLDGKYIPVVNNKFIDFKGYNDAIFVSKPRIFEYKYNAEELLNRWLTIKGLGLKSVGVDKEIEL